jgi:archaetidylinositol phosphate synthase
MTNQNEAVRIIPSPFEKQFDKLAAKLIPLIPMWMTPNKITILGFISGMAAVITYYLANFDKSWLILAAIFIFLHLLADSLDGSTARERNLTSKRGEFLDKILDTIFFFALPVGIGVSSYANFEIIIFIAIIALLHDVLLLLWALMKNKWNFPVIGVFEYHFFFIFLTVLTYFWHNSLLTLGNYSLGWFDLAVLIVCPLSFIDFCISSFKLFKELENN